jgi:hypothetical protein
MNAMKVKQLVVALALTAVVLPHLALADGQTATYRVTFNATWSSKTHPHAGLPAHPMFHRSSAACIAIEPCIGKSAISHRLESS